MSPKKNYAQSVTWLSLVPSGIRWARALIKAPQFIIHKQSSIRRYTTNALNVHRQIPRNKLTVSSYNLPKIFVSLQCWYVYL